MSREHLQDYEFPSSGFPGASDSMEIDRLCDEFESSWKTDSHLVIEQLLVRISERERSTLLRELLEIELEIRTTRNEVFSVQEYYDRFPGEPEIINLVFRRIVRRKKLGDYELISEIGHGGMGVVYRARQIYLDQSVAVKVLSQVFSSDSQIVSRFRREMRMIGSLNHPNIVRALNAGEAKGTLYLVMEYVEGANLHQLVKQFPKLKRKETAPSVLFPDSSPNSPGSDPGLDSASSSESSSSQSGPLCTMRTGRESGTQSESAGKEGPNSPGRLFPWKAAAEIVRQVAMGLEHAHSRGLVHRDLKPANLMITRSGTVKILDLGLGKFNAENRVNGPHEPALTQLGTTMGTVDYMSPEQCEDATEVDIRADIYSLGCSLFFMLTARAPFEDEEYSSQRKKIRAHLVTGIPSIELFREDCPKEFLEILRKMVAKDPQDRFQSPGELFRVIAPFADLAELQSLLSSAPMQRESDIPSTPAFRSCEDDTLEGMRGKSRDPRSSGKEGFFFPNPWIAWERLVLRKEYLLALLGGIAAISILLGFSGVFRGNRSELSPESISDPGKMEPENSPVKSPPNLSPQQRADAEERFERVVRDLVELPGLGGQWWFLETPWFFPFVRERIPEILQQGKSDIATFCREKFILDFEKEIRTREHSLPYLDSNLRRAYEFLDNIVKSELQNLPAHQRELVRAFSGNLDSGLSREEILPILEKHIFDYEKGIENPSASDFHTLALLQHRFAQLKSDPESAEKAARFYERAIEEYSREDRGSRFLLPVCMSDFARLNYWKEGDFSRFEKEATEILHREDLSELFRIVFLTYYGDVCISAGRNKDGLFEEADELLLRSEINAFEHPVAAYIRERYAWSLIDQCQFKEAAGKFYEALRIRENNRDQSQNPYASIYVYHNTHGIALTQRYFGDTEGAKNTFSIVVDRVQKTLEEAVEQGPAQLRYYNTLRERLANTLERYGDCTLYGGAASFGSSLSRVSISDLKQAADHYEQARDTAEDKGVKYVMGCKYAIVKAIPGQWEDAKTVLRTLDEGGELQFGGDRLRAQRLRTLADSVVLIKEGESKNDSALRGAGESKIREFLSGFNESSLNAPRYRRETLEIQLIAAEMLISSKLKNEGIEPAGKELIFLDPLLSPMVELDSTRPFLYRYYELAIRCCEQPEREPEDSSSQQRSVLNQLRYVRQSRSIRQNSGAGPANRFPGEKKSEVYFYFGSQGGFAIFVPNDERSIERFLIPYTRKQIQEAGNSGTRLDLPGDLGDLIESERASGNAPRIFFNDEICWYRKSSALLDDNWPFPISLK